MKYLGKYLIAYVQDLHMENYNTMMRDILKDLSK